MQRVLRGGKKKGSAETKRKHWNIFGWDVPTWNQWAIQTPLVFCLIHDVVAVTSHFLVVYECIASVGVFRYRDSKCIVTILIHSRHVEMVAGIHEGCSVPETETERIILFIVGRIACCVCGQRFSPTAWNRCQFSELFERNAGSMDMACDTFGKEALTDTDVYQVTANIGEKLGCWNMNIVVRASELEVRHWYHLTVFALSLLQRFPNFFSPACPLASNFHRFCPSYLQNVCN